MALTEQASFPVRVIGLISGTSVDGIDAALVEISGTDLDLHVELLAGATYPYPPELRERILAVGADLAISMAELAELDDAIAQVFAQAAQNIQIGYQPASFDWLPRSNCLPSTTKRWALTLTTRL